MAILSKDMAKDSLSKTTALLKDSLSKTTSSLLSNIRVTTMTRHFKTYNDKDLDNPEKFFPNPIGCTGVRTNPPSEAEMLKKLISDKQKLLSRKHIIRNAIKGRKKRRERGRCDK